MLRYPTNYIAITKPYSKTHNALDLGWHSSYGGKNIPVASPDDGVVTSVVDGKSNTLVPGDSGNYVTVEHSDGYKTRSCHLLKGSIRVKVGDKVKQGDTLALMGNSGYCGTSRGNHVHFIVWKSGKRVDPIKHTYAYPDQTIGSTTAKTYNILKQEVDPTPAPTPTPTPTPEDNIKLYVRIDAKNGVWCRKGIGYAYPKYKAIAYGTVCELTKKNAGKSNGYMWDEIIYNNVTVYVPNNWNIYV